MTRRTETPAVHAAKLAAHWAQCLNLPPGNLWEPAIVRHLLTQYRAWGDWPLVEAHFRLQLALQR